MPTDLLYLIAEVSIATVALSGITLVLASSFMGLNSTRASRIAAQLRMASLVTVVTMVPLVLNHIGLNDTVLWRTSTAVYILAIVSATAWNSKSAHAISPNGLIGVAAISALILLPLNLWLAASWPFVTQLFIAYAVSLGLFLQIIHEILSTSVADIDDV